MIIEDNSQWKICRNDITHSVYISSKVQRKEVILQGEDARHLFIDLQKATERFLHLPLPKTWNTILEELCGEYFQ